MAVSHINNSIIRTGFHIVFRKFVMEGVHPDAKYRLVALARLVGIQLAVLVNSQHYQYVKNVSTDSVGTGLLGKMVRTILCLFEFIIESTSF